MIIPYDFIRFDHDGVAWLTDRKVTVEQVMHELGKYKPNVAEQIVCDVLGIEPHHVTAAEDFARDSWCTPDHVAEVLPPRHRLIDPCSNPRSKVDAVVQMMLERGQNGLELPWVILGDPEPLAYVNAGFSDLMPWFGKLRAERALDHLGGAAFMVNVDSSTQWWQAGTDQMPCVLLFRKRLPFIPHPGVGKSSNNKPQALIGDRAFFEECKPGLFELGEMYEKTRARAPRAA